MCVRNIGNIYVDAVDKFAKLLFSTKLPLESIVADGSQIEFTPDRRLVNILQVVIAQKTATIDKLRFI